MTHISKRKLDSKILEKLFGQLSGVFKLAGNKSAIPSFTDEFYSKAEKVMFSKRLSAILFLDGGMPQQIVADKLKMSSSTITKLARGIEKGKYNEILKIAGKNRETLSKILLELLIDNLPRPFGRSRMRFGSIYRNSPSFEDFEEFNKRRKYYK